MDIIERAARALCKLDAEDKMRAGIMNMPTWDELGYDGQYYFFHQARAVLSALREPDEGMLATNRGWDSNPDIADEHTREVWQAMIDQALKG